MNGWWALSYAVLWLLVAVLCVVVVALARQIGTLHLRLGPRGALEIDSEGPALGEAPPPLTTTALDGHELTIGGPGSAQLLLFVSPSCMVCEQVLPSLETVARHAGMTPIVLTDSDPIEAQTAIAGRTGSARVAASIDATRTYGVPGTPYVIALDELGVARAKGTVNNLEQLEGLASTARRRTLAAGPARDRGE